MLSLAEIPVLAIQNQGSLQTPIGWWSRIDRQGSSPLRITRPYEFVWLLVRIPYGTSVLNVTLDSLTGKVVLDEPVPVQIIGYQPDSLRKGCS